MRFRRRWPDGLPDPFYLANTPECRHHRPMS
jgi:hypothetical protein